MDLTIFVIGIPLTVTIIVVMLLLTARQNKSIALETKRELAAARQNGCGAQARIVDLRRAEVQRYRRNNLTTFKFLLEVFPTDLQPVFTAGVVWELEPAAINALQPGAFVPIVFDRANLRRVFPETTGVHYFQENQHAFLGIENDFVPEEIAAAQRQQQQLASYAPAPNTIYRKRSRTVVCGLPLWEVAFNVINKKGRMRRVKSAKARAVFAVGDSATGVVAIGGFAKGLISVGQFSIGLFSFGLFSLGLVSVGGFGLGLFGFGAFGVGLLSVGTMSAGFASAGGLVIAKYPFSIIDKNPQTLELFRLLETAFGIGDSTIKDILGVVVLGFFALTIGFLLLSMLAQLAAVQILEPNDNRHESPPVNKT